MSGKDSGDKTEAPTPKRLREARRDGSIPRSQEITSWAAMLTATFLIQLTVAQGASRMSGLLHRSAHVIAQPDPGPAIALLGGGLLDAAVVVAPLALGLMTLSILSNLAQVGWTPSAKLLKPKIERINPFKGIKRLLSPHSLWEMAKTTIKLAVLALLVYRSINDVVPDLVVDGRQPVSARVALVGQRAISLVRSVALAGLVLAAVDYGMQRRRVAKNLRMTKHDVRQEQRQSEGDPHLKGAVRSRQMAMSRNRMMSEIAGADVVLVNPTHVAVALRYDHERGAPRVVAKGVGKVAGRIRMEADRAGVPMVQDVPLARAIHRACDLGQEIPADLYDAVARVLAFIFALRQKGKSVGMHQMPGPVTPLR